VTPAVTLLAVSPPDDTAPDLALLDPGESARAERFTVDHPRRVFISARAALRRTLGESLGRNPALLAFALGPHGKPELDPPSSLNFNLSHSGDTIVIALTERVELGVDVEELGRDTPTERLARRFFTQAEARAVETAVEANRDRVFFHCWTAKEAVLKATGSGLTVPVREVEVDPNPDAPPRLLALGGDVTEAERWTLLRHEVPGRWIATVAFRGEARVLVVEDRTSILDT
jgi:4'-phosphopantetheinyl transferase